MFIIPRLLSAMQYICACCLLTCNGLNWYIRYMFVKSFQVLLNCGVMVCCHIHVYCTFFIVLIMYACMCTYISQHASLSFSSLPDQAFVDLALMKLDRKRFNKRIDVNEPSNLRGSFAKVVKRTFNTHVSIPLCMVTK